MTGVDAAFMLLILAQVWLITCVIMPSPKPMPYARWFTCIFPGMLNVGMLLIFYGDKLTWIRWLS